MKKAYESGTLSSFKKEELKEFLTLKSLPSTGVKNFLCDMISQYFDNWVNHVLGEISNLKKATKIK